MCFSTCCVQPDLVIEISYGLDCGILHPSQVRSDLRQEQVTLRRRQLSVDPENLLVYRIIDCGFLHYSLVFANYNTKYRKVNTYVEIPLNGPK